MIGDFGETPNPLNPSPTTGGGPDTNPLGASALDANPSEPVQSAQPTQAPTQQTEPMRPARPVHMGRPMRVNGPVDAVRPAHPAESATQAGHAMPIEPMVETTEVIEDFRTLEEGVPAQAPISQPMQEPADFSAKNTSGSSTPKKKKKTGLFVAMIVCLFVAVGCAVAAILIFANIGNVDAVKAAVDKLVNGATPSYVTAKGNIDIAVKDESSMISRLRLDLDTAIVTNSMMNSTTATLTATLNGGGDISAKLTEVYVADGDVFIKIDGITEALQNMQTVSPAPLEATLEAPLEISEETIAEPIDCIADEEGCEAPAEPPMVSDEQALALQDAMLSIFSSIAETVDGEWIRLSTDEAGDTLGSIGLTGDTQCLVNLVTDIQQNKNTVAKIYNDNAFISSAEGTPSIAKQTNPIYQLAFDNVKMGSFMDALENTAVIKNFNQCMQADDTSETLDELESGLGALPTIYVEIDGNYNITRLYTVVDTDEATATVDLSFTYPQNINITEPGEYTDFNELLQQMFMTEVTPEGGETQTVVEGL